MVLTDGSSVLLSNYLLILNLGISLLSAKRICSDQSIKGSFNSERMCFHKNREKILEAIVQGGLYIVSWLRNGPSKTVYVTTDAGKITPAVTTPIVYSTVYNAICTAVDQPVALPASDQSHVISSKTITKDRRAKGLHYVSDISDEDYYYHNAGEASESEVDEHALDEDIKTEVDEQGLDESDTDIEMEGLSS
jgi:hypothetical protein